MSLRALVKHLSLGSLVEPPLELKGGALHRTWRVATASGDYAIKCLNPYVTAKENFKINYEISEKIAYELSKSQVPAVTALSFHGERIIEYNNEFFIVYPFINGRIVDDQELTVNHAHCVGLLYSMIHCARIKPVGTETSHLDVFTSEHWKRLISQSKNANLTKLLPNILNWNDLYQSTICQLLKESVVTHRDMHGQNILWSGSDPNIIDWESAGLMNPMLEIIGYGLEWSGIILEQKVNINFFESLIKSYIKNQGVKWTTTVKQGFIGWLGHCVLAWTEFNLRRMLGEITSDQQEINKGSEVINNKMIPCLKYISRNESYLHELIDVYG